MFKFIRALAALGLLMGLVVAFALALIELFRQVFHGLDPTVGSAIIAAVATVIVSILAVVLARYYERRQGIEMSIREKKLPAYTALVSGLFKLSISLQRSARSVSN